VNRFGNALVAIGKALAWPLDYLDQYECRRGRHTWWQWSSTSNPYCTTCFVEFCTLPLARALP
jgi:hypothetical protein